MNATLPMRALTSRVPAAFRRRSKVITYGGKHFVTNCVSKLKYGSSGEVFTSTGFEGQRRVYFKLD